MNNRNFTPGFDRAFAHTVGLEGAYSNDPKDPGGETKWGITHKTAKAWGYYLPMRDMPLDVAKAIYWDHYWLKIGGTAMEKLAPTLAQILFDIGVNTSNSRAITWLQMSLNALNVQEAKYADIAEDGGWGPKTRGALETFLTWRTGQGGEDVLIKCVSSLQGHHYINISRNKPELETFVFGWFKNRIHLEVKK